MSNTSNTSFYVFIYIITFIGSVYLGTRLRKRRERRTTERLIRDIESLLSEPLPKYKKGQHSDQINWDRVYNSLKKQPQTEQVTKLMKDVDNQIRMYYKRHKRK